MNNNKGFTLIELLATLLLLAIVIGIGTLTVTNIVRNSKEKDYENLLTNIKDGAEVYYQECKYSNNSKITCAFDLIENVKIYKISLGDLVRYGYIKGNSKNNSEDKDKKLKFTLVNSYDELDISSCSIGVKYDNEKIVITNESTDNVSCPTTSEYTSGKIDSNRKK